MKPEESIELLHQAHNEPLPDVHYAAVRARVLAEIARPRPARFRSIWNVAAFCAAAAVIWILLARPQRVPLRPVPVSPSGSLATAAPRPNAIPQPSTARPHHARRHASNLTIRRAGLKPARPAAAEPLVVKLITSDPNVVIYWISTSTGE